MSNRSLSDSELHDLEQMIDRVGLSALLSGLKHICFEKADHLESAWQDRRGAAVWTAVAKKLDVLAHSRAVKSQP